MTPGGADAGVAAANPAQAARMAAEVDAFNAVGRQKSLVEVHNERLAAQQEKKKKKRKKGEEGGGKDGGGGKKGGAAGERRACREQQARVWGLAVLLLHPGEPLLPLRRAAQHPSSAAGPLPSCSPRCPPRRGRLGPRAAPVAAV